MHHIFGYADVFIADFRQSQFNIYLTLSLF